MENQLTALERKIESLLASVDKEAAPESDPMSNQRKSDSKKEWLLYVFSLDRQRGVVEDELDYESEIANCNVVFNVLSSWFIRRLYI